MKPPPKLRADAQRNRERLLEIAKQHFTRLGPDISMDDIARETGVGPGTLYRHFPSRDALLEAVYRVEVEKLAAAQPELSRTLPPLQALTAWMLLFVDYIETKQIIAPALNCFSEGPSKLFAAYAPAISQAMETLVQSAVQSGDICPDIDPNDLLRALVGVSSIASTPNWAQSARRLVEILIKGSRP